GLRVRRAARDQAGRLRPRLRRSPRRHPRAHVPGAGDDDAARPPQLVVPPCAAPGARALRPDPLMSMAVPPRPPLDRDHFLPPSVPAIPEDDDAAHERAQAARAWAERAQAESNRAERAQAAAAEYARDREAFQNASRRYLLAAVIFVGAQITVWVLRFRG